MSSRASSMVGVRPVVTRRVSVPTSSRLTLKVQSVASISLEEEPVATARSLKGRSKRYKGIAQGVSVLLYRSFALYSEHKKNKENLQSVVRASTFRVVAL